MKHTVLILVAVLLAPQAALQAIDTTTISVDSPAFLFSPANWTGDAGRAGKGFRQTWNSGAYFRVAWETANVRPVATIVLDTSTYTSNVTVHGDFLKIALR